MTSLKRRQNIPESADMFVVSAGFCIVGKVQNFLDFDRHVVARNF